MDETTVDLRAVLARTLDALTGHTHRELDQFARDLAIPIPPKDEVAPGEPELTKAQRLTRAGVSLAQHDPRPVLMRLSACAALSHGLRLTVEDTLWSADPGPALNLRQRRDLAEALGQHGVVYGDVDAYIALLERLFDLDLCEDFLGASRREQILQHTVRNPDDWSVPDLFQCLGAFSCSTQRFLLLVEGLLSGAVIIDEARHRELEAAVATPLATAGLALHESHDHSGYPGVHIVRSGTRQRPAQALIFASTKAKPDLRLSDVLDRELELITDGDVLMYTAGIGRAGLTWADLQDWWQKRTGTSELDAKHGLWRRLLASLPTSSPPQEALFRAYYRLYGGADPLYALIPEVWLHWDPRNRNDRDTDALLTQRMDFLLLLPNYRRVVIEVDGQRHYVDDRGHPSPERYAQTVRGDRDLRLNGYEVYRFGGFELTAQRARQTTQEFFDQLLKAR